MINFDVFMSFRNDLKGGMTLENALRKYGLSLREAFQYCHRKNLDNPYRFIYLCNGSFQVRRVVDGRNEYYYCCKELDEAVLVRDKLMEHDWDRAKMPEILRELDL